MKRPSSCLLYAQEYAALGLRVFPVRRPRPDGQCSCGSPKCHDAGKHPHVKQWPRVATTDADLIRVWWQRWPDANIGVATGEGSGIFVVDVDPRHGGDETLHELCAANGDLPDTPVSLTGGGGQHLFFQHPGFFVENDIGRALGPGLDIKGEGGVVVVEPSLHASGKEYVWDAGAHISDMPPAPAPAWVLARIRYRSADGKGAGTLPERIPEGKRNDTLTSLAGSMRRRGASEDSIRAAIQIENERRCDPPLPPSEVDRIAASIASYPAGGTGESAAYTSAPPAIHPAPAHCEGPTQRPIPDDAAYDADKLSDDWNARRLIAAHGHDLRFCHVTRTWYVWDGRRFCPDHTGEVDRRAKDVARGLYEVAASIGNDAERDALLKWIRHSLSAQGRRNMLDQARSELAVLPAHMDTDLFLLNALNGTVDLRTGRLLPHRREDLITKLAPVNYDPDATDDLWNNLIERVTKDHAGVADYLQRAFGYAITGDTREDRVFVLVSEGGGGKSTLLQAIARTLGDYASSVLPDVFFTSRRSSGGHNEDIADLAGVRLVVTAEPSRDSRLGLALLKLLTGGEGVRASRKHEHSFTFTPQFTPFIAANFAPAADDDDSGAWRRIRKIPWTPIPQGERDPKVRQWLTSPENAGSAILAWLVRGCLSWQRDGLPDTEAIAKATEDYRQENDPVEGFFREQCTFGNDPSGTPLRAPAGRLRSAYEAWARENGAWRLVGGVEWGRRLRARGCSVGNSRGMGGRFWYGVGLLADQQQGTQ